MFVVNIILGEISKVFFWSHMYLTRSEGAHSQAFRSARNSEDGYFSKLYALLQPENPLFRVFYTQGMAKATEDPQKYKHSCGFAFTTS